MAWHFHNETHIDWGGYTWSPELFPQPENFLTTLREMNLNTVLNLHLRPIQYGADKGYFDVGSKLGWDRNQLQSWSYPPIPSAQLPPPYNTDSVHTLLLANQTFGEAYLDNLDSMNTTWWWLDDAPVWTARILYEHSAKLRDDRRGIAFSRWAGVGSHRYPIGFSGDTFMEWCSLQFQTRFTVAAANVLFWWSHDIGGHRSKRDFAAYDPELYLRWLQWGTHAPILRTHPQPDPKVERRPYGYALPISEYMAAAMRRRARLVPLLTTHLRVFEASAVPPLRGLYVDWPQLPGAYSYNDTFLYCEHLVVAPVTNNVTNMTQMASRDLWLPPGEWVSTVDGDVTIAGPKGQFIKGNFTLWENPVWVRSGSMLPVGPRVGSENALGFAHRADVVSATGWEVWMGGARYGEGNATVGSDADRTNGQGETVITASFAMSDDGMTLQLNSTLSACMKSTFFEVKGVYRAANVRPCTGLDHLEAGWEIGKTTYSPSTLTQSVHVLLNNGGGLQQNQGTPTTVCIKVTSPKSMLPPPQPANHGGYIGRRLRALRLKAMMDDELHNPRQVAMPLVVSVNSAVRVDAAVRRGDFGGANAEMDRFDESLSTALHAILHKGCVRACVRVPSYQDSLWVV